MKKVLIIILYTCLSSSLLANCQMPAVGATATPEPSATHTAVPPTDTPVPTSTLTDTPVPTDTNTPVPTDTPTETLTPTITNSPTPEPTSTPAPTDTPMVLPSPTPCTGGFDMLVVNNTDASVTIYMYGPCNYIFTVGPGESNINVQTGEYNFVFQMCGQSFNVSARVGPNWYLNLEC